MKEKKESINNKIKNKFTGVKKMIKYIIGFVLVLLMIGCSGPVEETPQDETPVDEPKVEEQTETQTEEIEEEEVVTGTDVGAVVEEEKVSTPSGNIIRILGKQGFDIEELTVKKGSTITWINEDPKEEDIVVTFQKGRTFINSDIMPPGGMYEHTFDEVGTYDYWTLAYGVRAKIIVEG